MNISVVDFKLLKKECLHRVELLKVLNLTAMRGGDYQESNSRNNENICTGVIIGGMLAFLVKACDSRLIM